MSEANVIATVIVPVYNKVNFLETCFETLNAQNMDKESFETVFVDDGSTDGSLDALKALEREHDWIKVISQENSGVCAARNAGIRAARGKYLFFLDPDDEWTPNVLSGVSEAFDTFYDDTDVFTYKIIGMNGKKKQQLHYRYQHLIGTGIYDLNEGDNYLITQTTVNVCVKNRFSDNILFDFESENGVVFHEDQEYITTILMDKMTIGYFADAEYIWHINEQSTTSNLVYASDIFANTMNMYEKLFSRFDGAVPRYFQALFANDIGWKMRSNSLVPFYLHGAEREAAQKRFIALLDQIDDEVIRKHPNIHMYHRFHFMDEKHASPIEFHFGPGGMALERDGRVLHSTARMECYVYRTRTEFDVMHVQGIVKSPMLMFIDPSRVRLFVELRSKKSFDVEPVLLTDSELGRVGSKRKVARFLGFRYDLDLHENREAKFVIFVDDERFETYITTRKNTVNFSRELGNFVLMGDRKISLNAGAGQISIAIRKPKRLAADRKRQKRKQPKRVKTARWLISKIKERNRKRGHEIWLYSDAKGIAGNSWLQFLHDAEIEDGIKRYYASNEAKVDKDGKIGCCGKVIAFGSREHKLLYYAADKRLCSDIARKCIIPWSDRLRAWYCDLDNAEQIYLQHGVLWAHMPWYYSFERIAMDREVVSTDFEIRNLVENYAFERSDLIASGMPRYDFINQDASPTEGAKKVLMCPSWRGYLVGPLTDKGREPLEDTFKKSAYYENISALLRSTELKTLLEESGYTLDFKLHPNFECYSRLFEEFASGSIRIVNDEIDETDYAVVITDYSSYSFDFVYLKRALIYYIPDEFEFLTGRNHYNKLDISLDDAFGEYVHEPEEVIAALQRIVNNGGQPLPEYLAKEQNFFLHYDNDQRERLYRACLQARNEEKELE